MEPWRLMLSAQVATVCHISCQLYYCNSLFNGISDGLMTRLQSIQNAVVLYISCRALDGMTTSCWCSSRWCYTSCRGFRFGRR